MTPTELDEIEARAKAATPIQGHSKDYYDGYWIEGEDFGVAQVVFENDQPFYRAARADALALVAEVRALRAALVEVANYTSDEGPCWGRAPCCLADYGPGSRDDCRRIRELLK